MDLTVLEFNQLIKNEGNCRYYSFELCTVTVKVKIKCRKVVRLKKQEILTCNQPWPVGVHQEHHVAIATNYLWFIKIHKVLPKKLYQHSQIVEYLSTIRYLYLIDLGGEEIYERQTLHMPLSEIRLYVSQQRVRKRKFPY